MSHFTFSDERTECLILGAVLTNDLPTLYRLKNSGILSKCINYVDSKVGKTILMHAVMSASLPTVDFLLRVNELDINATEARGLRWTALFQAASSGRKDMVQRLVQHPLIKSFHRLHQQPDIKIDITDSAGNTAAYYAGLKGHDSIVQLLTQEASPKPDTTPDATSSHLSELTHNIRLFKIPQVIADETREIACQNRQACL